MATFVLCILLELLAISPRRVLPRGLCHAVNGISPRIVDCTWTALADRQRRRFASVGATVPRRQVDVLDQREGIIRIVGAERLQSALGEQEFLRLRVQSPSIKLIAGPGVVEPGIAELTTDDDPRASPDRLGLLFKGRSSGPRPCSPELVLLAVNSTVAPGLYDDAHQLEPVGRDQPSRCDAGRGLPKQAASDIIFPIACDPVRLYVDLVHGRDRVPSLARRPLVVFQSKVGGVDLHRFSKIGVSPPSAAERA